MLGLETLGLTGLFIGCFLAATVIPFSSDALYIAVLLATKRPLACFIVGTLGNWLGGVTSYYLGYLAKWKWLEKYFHIKHATLEKQKRLVDKYGVWLALLTWIPVVGDVFAIALGFYRTPAFWTLLLMLVGKAGRFLLWNFVSGWI